jgi:5,10-methylene-tetrahydrofolate dehydrogenase/methenyl tetrahydrofolate cyclohydrolase
MLLIAIAVFSIPFDSLGQRRSPARYGNLIGGGIQISDREWREAKQAEEAKRIAEKQKADDADNAVYAAKQKQRAPEIAKKVMQFRLEQATNGNHAYQCLISTNYLNGTDGFPTNKVLAEYWAKQALENKKGTE